MPTLTSKETAALLFLAAFGLLVPNGIFIYFCVTDLASFREACTNPISLVFIAEAFFLMFLVAWLLGKMRPGRPSGFVFVVMSLLGSLAFSVPATFYWMLKKAPVTTKAGNHGNSS